MNKQTDFFIYLLEHYAAYKKTGAEKILALWDSLNLTDFINSMYERYHSEHLENAFEDIDRLTEEKTSSKS